VRLVLARTAKQHSTASRPLMPTPIPSALAGPEGVYDFGIEEVFWLDQWFLRGAAGDGDGLAEFARGVDVVNAAADDARLRDDRAILPLVPSIAHADGNAVLELQWSDDGAR